MDAHLGVIASDKLVQVTVHSLCQLFVTAMQAQQLGQASNGCMANSVISVFRQALQGWQHPSDYLHPQNPGHY